MDEGKLRKSSWMAAVKKFVGLSFVQRHCPSQPCKLYVNPLWGKVHVEVRVDGSGGGGAMPSGTLGHLRTGHSRPGATDSNVVLILFAIQIQQLSTKRETKTSSEPSSLSLNIVPYRSSCSHLHLLSSIISLFILLFVILDDSDGSIIKDEY